MYTISLLIVFLCAANGLTKECIEYIEAKNFKRICELEKHILLINNKLASEDIYYFKSLFKNVEVIGDKCPGGVQGLIEATKLLPNCYIINLNVPDFYEFNYNNVSQHLIYGGDRNHSEREVEACVVKLNTTYITCNENATQKVSYPTVKLMSANVENYPELQDAVVNYGEGHIEKHAQKAKAQMSHYYILICTDDIKNEDYIYNNGIGIKFSSHCENDVKSNQMYLLAVVTAKPLETDYDIMVPIILYQAPCYDENISKIHNYVIMTKCDHYKYALLEFLKSVGWTRVALVSDNAAYSEKFEREVRALFDENQFAYTVVKCHETATARCNFVEALKSLKKSDGRVFIANVDEDNARIIQEQAPQVWAQPNLLSSWIFRGFMLTGNTKAMGDIYSLFLEPTNNRHMNSLLQISDDIRYKSSIISAIQIIQVAYNNTRLSYDYTKRKYFYRKLTNEIRKRLSSDTIVSVHLKNPPEVFTKINIKNSKVTVLKKRQRREDMSSCSIRRSDYHNPCDDYNLLNIMIVLVVLASCGLVAAICYNRFDMNIRQYSNLE